MPAGPRNAPRRRPPVRRRIAHSRHGHTIGHIGLREMGQDPRGTRAHPLRSRRAARSRWSSLAVTSAGTAVADGDGKSDVASIASPRATESRAAAITSSTCRACSIPAIGLRPRRTHSTSSTIPSAWSGPSERAWSICISCTPLPFAIRTGCETSSSDGPRWLCPRGSLVDVPASTVRPHGGVGRGG